MKRNWLTDFKLEGNGSVLIKKTGHRLRLDLQLAHDIFTWFCFYFFAQAWRVSRRLTGHKRPTIAFSPDKPRPWYLIWPVMHVAGARLVESSEDADIVMQFDDTTETANDLPPIRKNARTVNFGCIDISKTRVAQAFETAAGYSLAVDPQTYTGPMVDKSEINATHDGRVIAGPIPREEGRAYQRLVDNTIAGGMVEDLRTCTVNGEPVLVFKKRRPIARRFQNENSEVLMFQPHEVFTPNELDVIRAFTKEIHLDWARRRCVA